MADRELLEKAARAARIEWLCWDTERQAFKLPPGGSASRWNALADDGDAMRLAVRLSMTVIVDVEAKRAVATWYTGKIADEPFTDHDSAERATRRAIVRCAAMALEVLEDERNARHLGLPARGVTPCHEAQPVAWMTEMACSSPVVTDAFLRAHPQYRRTYTIPLYRNAGMKEGDDGR